MLPLINEIFLSIVAYAFFNHNEVHCIKSDYKQLPRKKQLQMHRLTPASMYALASMRQRSQADEFIFNYCKST